MPAGSFGVIWHDATPLGFVMTGPHDWVPFSVIVTGSLAAGKPVYWSIRVACTVVVVAVVARGVGH